MIYPEMMLEEFQSTLPRGERHSRHPATCPFLDFNPRSREGSDGPLHCDCTAVHNFNPRSREGSDQTQASGPVFLSDFNPRSREGSDMGGRDVALPLRNISIHAPARGATHIHLILSKINPRFQSTLPRGERRLMIFTVSLELDNFNPRSREGSDGIIILFFFGVCNFNPRSREGSDWTGWYAIAVHEKFQSTLPRGERPVTFIYKCF